MPISENISFELMWLEPFVSVPVFIETKLKAKAWKDARRTESARK